MVRQEEYIAEKDASKCARCKILSVNKTCLEYSKFQKILGSKVKAKVTFVHKDVCGESIQMTCSFNHSLVVMHVMCDLK